MTRALVLLAVFATLFAAKGFGAIRVGPGGTGVQAFESAPASSNWSTLSIPGLGGEIPSAAALDADVQLLNAANISNSLPTTATIPPSQNMSARWNSAWQLLQMRATGNRYTVLMATLQNKSATILSNLQARYAFGSGFFVREEIPGWRAYFSTTGTPGSWRNVPEFSTGSAGLLTATLDPGAWAPDALLYLLWADDQVDGANDAYYTLDDFAVWPVLPTNAFVSVSPGGTDTNDFSTYPQTAGWTGRPLTSGLAADITNAVQLDAAVQQLSADDVARPVGMTATTPPDGGAYTDWHRNWQCLDTSPTGVGFAATRATLRNDTGVDISSLTIDFDGGDGGIPADEDIPVYRAYFNLTGLPGQWQVIPSLCSVTGRLSATLNLGHWPAGETLYLLWADDNGPRAASSQLPREGTYTLDNFSAEPGPPFLAVTRLSASTNQFTWPDFITNYTLASATNLNAPAWRPVTEPDIPATGFHP